MWIMRTLMDDGVIVEQFVYWNRDIRAYHVSPAFSFSTDGRIGVIYGKKLGDIINARQPDGRRIMHSNIRNRLEL